MSNLYIRQRIFSWTDSYDVYGEDYTPRYFVRADFFSVGKRIRIFDKATGEEVGVIRQKVLAILKEYEVYLYGRYATRHAELPYFAVKAEISSPLSPRRS